MLPGWKKIPLPTGWVNARMIKDNYKRQMAAENEVTIRALKYIARNTTLPQKVRIEAQLQLATMPHYTHLNLVKNRCVQTGKGRGILRDFRLSRVCIFF